MQRRDLLKALSIAGLAPSLWSTLVKAAPLTPYTGTLYLTLAAEGGWDVTSYCDPKMNVSGEAVINHWAQSAEIQTVASSPIKYAPVGNNAFFFEKYAKHMLVVNGVDAQTNSHDAGVRNNWSGRLASGFPAFPALVAYQYGDNLPLAYLSGGGYRETAKLVNFSLIQNPSTISNLIRSNKPYWGDAPYINTDELALIQQYQRERLVALTQKAHLPKMQQKTQFLLSSRDSRQGMDRLLEILPETFVNEEQISARLGADTLNTLRYNSDGGDNIWGIINIFQQVQATLLSYKAGLCVSGDLVMGGFDTHDNHDEQHPRLLSILNHAVDYLFDYADELGVADKIFLAIGSDFSRTPNYNDDNGKDHWPIGSFVFMQKNAPWANRVVGVTDELHNALSINPNTFQVDATQNGVLLNPKHIHAAMHRLAGIDQNAVVKSFNLEAEAVDLFLLNS